MPRARRQTTIAKVMPEKMECLWKPAQSGKTRTIQEIIRADDGVQNHLNIIVCSNNRLLVAQTKARMHTDVYAPDDASVSSTESEVEEVGPSDDKIVGGVYSWMSGTKKTNISANDLSVRVMLGEVSMIVCCAHKARFRYLSEMLTVLERLSFAKPVNVWIDEADVSVKHWSGDYDFSRFRCVRKVTLVSATFGAVFDHYERIRVMPFPDTHPACYRGLRDCHVVGLDAEARGSAEYVDAVLKSNAEMSLPSMKLFVPGDIERVSHDAIATNLTKRGFIVMVLNGVEKGFRFPDGRVVPIEMSMDDENPDELSQVLARSYREYGMERYPFAVTGQLCLGRGITFQSRDFLFDYAIIPGMKDAAAAYQCVARVLGNVCAFGGLPPSIYMSKSLHKAVSRQERIATNLARLVHDKDWVDVGLYEVGLAAEDVSDMDWSQEVDGSPLTFATALDAKKWGDAHLIKTPRAMYPCDADREKTAQTHYILREDCVPILPVRELLSSSGRLTASQGSDPTTSGACPRVHPVMVDGAVRYLVVFKKFFIKSA
jgi:hypothetical protein